MLDLINNILKYNGKNIKYVIDKENKPWFKGKDVAILLDYENTDQAIRLHISENDKQKLEKIGPLPDRGLIFNDKESIYINVPGMFDLIFGSKKKKLKDLDVG